MTRSGTGAMPHFVLRRGHRGRYRFTFMSGDVTVSGEVQTDRARVDRAEADLSVRQKILEMAGVFALWMEKSVAGEHDDARPFLKRTTGMLRASPDSREAKDRCHGSSSESLLAVD